MALDSMNKIALETVRVVVIMVPATILSITFPNNLCLSFFCLFIGVAIQSFIPPRIPLKWNLLILAGVFFIGIAFCAYERVSK